MNRSVFKLGEFSGSDCLEFRKGNANAGRKFLRQDSLYVLDDAFFFFLESLFQKVIPAFDMFEDTCVTRSEWQKVMRLNISETVLPEFVTEAEETLAAIDRCWIATEIGETEGFRIIGVWQKALPDFI